MKNDESFYSTNSYNVVDTVGNSLHAILNIPEHLICPNRFCNFYESNEPNVAKRCDVLLTSGNTSRYTM